MKGKTFKFDPDLWLNNRSLRTCSMGARGLWIEMLALCCDGEGYMVLNGRPIDDATLASLVGAPVKAVRGWIAELGQAQIFSVTADGRLYSSKMVRDVGFVAQAKAHGVVGQQRKKAKAVAPASEIAPSPKRRAPEKTELVPEIPPASEVAEPGPMASPATKNTPPADVPKAKPLPWWKSPAGWVRKGAEQAISYSSSEDIEEFKYRVASRIPMGPHIEALTPIYRGMVEDNVKKYEKKPGE